MIASSSCLAPADLPDVDLPDVDLPDVDLPDEQQLEDLIRAVGVMIASCPQVAAR